MACYKVFDQAIYIDPDTGCFAPTPEILDYFSKISPNLALYHPSFSNYQTTQVTFCINLSDACNLNCDYCFNRHKSGKAIPMDRVFRFLNHCFSFFPDKEKYVVDLSGKGEPILYLNRILKIKDYCIKKADELRKEVLVQFVSNGTLLNQETAEILTKHEILFGVSLDGNQKVHDLHRRTKSGKATYRTILSNVRAIKHHEYVGAACTLTSSSFSLTESLVDLAKTFHTISYKPVRDCEEAITNDTLPAWLSSYDALCHFLVKEAEDGSWHYLKILLNGDDYFGKFIRRALLGQRTPIRCDAGLSRFALDTDNNVYACPAAFSVPELKMGDQGALNPTMISERFQSAFARRQCTGCDFIFFCGGECPLEKVLSHGNNPVMCQYKKHLILLSLYLVLALMRSPLYHEVYRFCQQLDARHRADSDLLAYLQKHPDLSFTEGKRRFDKEHHRY